MKFIAFLRGINVGGHHKVPMAELKDLMLTWGYANVISILNSGNIIFEGNSVDEEVLSKKLEQHFGFPIPTLIKTEKEIRDLLDRDPFKDHELSKEKRFYISFLKSSSNSELSIPWSSVDGSFQILEIYNDCIISLLDLGIGKTPKAMEVLEKNYGKEITTRNWNTILIIEGKL